MRTSAPFWLAAPCAALLLLFGACDGGGGAEPPDVDPPRQTGGTFAVGLAEPTALAPASSCNESECSTVLGMLHDPVVSIEPESGRLIYNGLAASIESSRSHTVWTVTLNKGRTFHNGEPVNAEAFVRAWNYSQDQKNTQVTAGYLARIKGAGTGDEMSGLRVVNDLTFQVTLDGPFSQFGRMLSYTPAFAPIAKECLNALAACNEHPIGTGPYQMAGEWRHDEGITLKRWSGYRGDQPANADGIEFAIFPTGADAYLDFQNGGVDVLTIAPEIYVEVKGALGDELIEAPTASVTYLGFPTRHAPYDNVDLRRALSLAVDRELIVERSLGRLGLPADDMAALPIPGYREDACRFCVFDVQRANDLLDASGVDPESLTLEMYFPADSGHEQWMEAAARQIEDNLGIAYELKPLEWPQYLQLRDAHELTGPFAVQWSPAYLSLERYLRPLLGTSSDSNHSGYSSFRFEELLGNGDRAAALSTASHFYRQADAVALEELPLVPIWTGAAAVAASDEVSNVRFDVGRDGVALGEVTVAE